MKHNQTRNITATKKFIFLSVLWILAVTPITPACSFDDITNPTSSVCKNVSVKYNFESRLRTLLSYARKEDKYTYHLDISRVPYERHNRTKMTTLTVSIFLAPDASPHSLEKVVVHITPSQPLLYALLPESVAYFFGDTTDTKRPYIRGAYKKYDGQWHRHSGLFEMPHHLNEQVKTVSGTTVYHLFHALQEILQPDYVSIGDTSQLRNGMLLRVLRLFTSPDNHTFYERFGYVPARDAITYNVARCFLTRLPIAQYARDFRDDPIISVLLARYHEDMHKHRHDQIPTACTFNNCSCTIAELVRTIYLAVQQDPSNVQHATALQTLYKRCLTDYQMPPSAKKTLVHEAIIESQRIIRDTTHFAKRYTPTDMPQDFRNTTRTITSLRSRL